MKKLILLILLFPLLLQPVQAEEFVAPTVPEEVEAVFPEDPTSFSDGLKEILQDASLSFRPAIVDCIQTCARVIAIVLLTSLFAGSEKSTQKTIEFSAALSAAVILLSPTKNIIYLSQETMTQITQYGKLLLPVMATAMTAQGAPTSSAALYGGTVFMNAILGSLITGLLIPLVYIYVLLGVANSMICEELLGKIRDFVKWLLTWSLKILLYVFTGYMSISGVISGTVDASALKAAKIAISGVVPVVGGIISDASEAVLVSAGIMKNSAGIYGILALISILIGPFIKIGAQYLTLKLTAAICHIFSCKSCTNLLKDITGAMGVMLAMTGTCCLLQLISTVCFMRGVGI